VRRGFTTLLVALVLVGLPLGILLTARRSAPRLPSPALVLQRLHAQLRRQGATGIECSWTRLAGASFQASCSGQGGSSASSTTLYELATIVGPPHR
jgi:hypothetical protein